MGSLISSFDRSVCRVLLTLAFKEYCPTAHKILCPTRINIGYIFYALFWVIHRRLKFVFQRFGTLCSIFIGG
jgi:hypothetical protein